MKKIEFFLPLLNLILFYTVHYEVLPFWVLVVSACLSAIYFYPVRVFFMGNEMPKERKERIIYLVNNNVFSLLFAMLFLSPTIGMPISKIIVFVIRVWFIFAMIHYGSIRRDERELLLIACFLLLTGYLYNP
ncbi:MAG: hypothetical protein CSB06_01440 [Bacteroidia bacterium]|nr:MAG: hypothetical protein CSB06_01440 [Bacteroidia bacterium]